MDTLFEFAAKMRLYGDVIGLVLFIMFCIAVSGTVLGFWIAKQIKKARTKINNGDRG